MKIKITGANNNNWYRDFIGKIFDAEFNNKEKEFILKDTEENRKQFMGDKDEMLSLLLLKNGLKRVPYNRADVINE